MRQCVLNVLRRQWISICVENNEVKNSEVRRIMAYVHFARSVQRNPSC